MYHGSEVPTLRDLFTKVPQDRLLRLTHLTLHGARIRVDPLTLPHLRSLVYLDLNRLYAMSPADTDDINDTWECTSAADDIFATLAREKIHLKQVVTNHIDDVLLDYLYSCSGLETLEMSSVYSSTTTKSHAFAHRFYKDILPKLVDSIQVLIIRPLYEGGWCYNVDDVFSVLSQCKKLRSLTICFDSASASSNSDNTVCSFDMRFFAYLTDSM